MYKVNTIDKQIKKRLKHYFVKDGVQILEFGHSGGKQKCIERKEPLILVVGVAGFEPTTS